MLRFAIRDVLWRTVVVAMGVGWVIDRRRLQSESHQRINALGSVLDMAKRKNSGPYRCEATMRDGSAAVLFGSCSTPTVALEFDVRQRYRLD